MVEFALITAGLGRVDFIEALGWFINPSHQTASSVLSTPDRWDSSCRYFLKQHAFYTGFLWSFACSCNPGVLRYQKLFQSPMRHV